MKFRNILLAGLSAVALASCSDYLDVDAPSKLDPDYVYTDKQEMRNALNGVYASMLSKDTYGQAFLEKLCFNTDVDFNVTSSESDSPTGYRRYECKSSGGDIKKAWDALYTGIERANMLINGIQTSDIYDEEDSELMQMLGEAKVLRAIFYHDLVWYFGDVPYSLLPSYENKEKIYDVEDRAVILNDLIKDLESVAPFMQLSSSQGFTDNVQRISKDMAWSMIARLAMTAGGYSLYPEGGLYGTMRRTNKFDYKEDFYKKAIDYCDSVVEKGGHNLTKAYHKVFVDECNFKSESGDDVIFEIPFGSQSTGNIGYIHGPKMDNAEGRTPHNWGKASGSAQLNALYRFMFDPDDVRRDFVNQLWSYNSNGEATFNSSGRSNYNGKWSKLWNENGLGATTEEYTGFNYPYMRYTDVLLMSAEAENEYYGTPTQKAIQRYEKVRERAFRESNSAKISQPKRYGSKEDFLKAVLDERKFEFAGENMRWRDLVRNNMLNENVYWAYIRYFAAADGASGYKDYVSEYDHGNSSYYDKIWMDKIYYINNVKNSEIPAASQWTEKQFPQRSPNMSVVYIVNPNSIPANGDEKIKIKVNGKDTTVGGVDYMNWFNNDAGLPQDYFLNSLHGYIFGDMNGNWIINNGSRERAPEPSDFPTYEDLPVIRYILPYPDAVITRSQGKYKQNYGYK
ncbi:MAG: RagB/SusD family nutrient uptake outer membrane protein [Duncaniella sp.]|uniref:RagB/SusD family nutrient uptake outer membrane protein n=1 Tax=Duncaniella sp. TaxID=2518496 RepID=UPI0023BD9676|nr:RagB/SusD family nutrient uptake outer membrane protein [Duncaniella sp.]MDE5989857.1 RagB/SusD family nutrient uptake outer membrane protein [Duncaniella sp.]